MDEPSLLPLGACTGCGGTVISVLGQKRRRWCSGGCRSSWNHRRMMAERPIACRVYFGRCPECDVPWCSPTGSTKYCSVACRTVYLNRRRLANGGTRKYVERRRVRKNQAPSEKIERLVVGERDGWVCWLCEELVDPALSYPDPKSLSVDHVVPLSRGGSHTYANVRAAHLDCNVKRGAGADAPMTEVA